MVEDLSYLACPKCLNYFVFAELKNFDQSLTHDQINKFLEKARSFDKCFIVVPYPEKDMMYRLNYGSTIPLFVIVLRNVLRYFVDVDIIHLIIRISKKSNIQQHKKKKIKEI